MKLCEISIEAFDKVNCGDITPQAYDKITKTEIVPRKLVEDALSMFEIWERNTAYSMDETDKETDTATYAMYDGWHNGVRDCINYLKGLLAELEGDEDEISN